MKRPSLNPPRLTLLSILSLPAITGLFFSFLLTSQPDTCCASETRSETRSEWAYYQLFYWEDSSGERHFSLTTALKNSLTTRKEIEESAMQAASFDELKLLFEKERPTHIIVRGKGEVILLRQGEKSKSEILDIDKHDLNEIARICDSLKIAFN